MSHIVLQEFTQILNNKELLNKIENFNKKTLVKKNKFTGYSSTTYKGFHTQYDYLTRSYKQEVLEFITQLSEQYNIQKELLKKYYFLDKKIVEYFSSGRSYLLEEIFGYYSIKEAEEQSLYVKIGRLKDLFSDKQYKTTTDSKMKKFLNENKQYFPLSTQKYLKQKLKDMDFTTKISKVTNSFQAKMLKQEFPKKYNDKKVKSFFNNLENLYNSNLITFEERLKTYYYVFDILDEMYKEDFDKEYKDELTATFVKLLGNQITNDVEPWYEMVCELFSNESKNKIVKNFEENLKNEQYFYGSAYDLLLVRFLEEYYKNDNEIQEQVQIAYRKILNRNLRKSFFDVSKIEGDFYEQIKNEAIRQAQEQTVYFMVKQEHQPL